jgi:hypothetical protein
MMLSADQQTANAVADFIVKRNLAGHRFLYAHPYLSEVLKIDPFDEKRRGELKIDNFKPGDVIIWENWFAVVENGISKTMLDNDSALMLLNNTTVSKGGREIQYCVYSYGAIEPRR